MRARHWNGLDGLRAVAVLLVIGTHVTGGLPGGYVGVDVFFVLSGFLITSLLLSEISRSGRIDYIAFYWRRLLRLGPALLVAVVGAAICAATFAPKPFRSSTVDGLPFVIFYIGDYARALSADPNKLGLLGHTWSLSVEEQFYFLWPTCLWALTRLLRVQYRTTMLLVGLSLVAVIWNAVLASGTAHGVVPDRAYYSLDGHCAGLLAGAALATFLKDKKISVGKMTASAIGWLCALLVVAVALKLGLTDGDEIFAVALSSGAAVVLGDIPGCCGWAWRRRRRTFPVD